MTDENRTYIQSLTDQEVVKGILDRDTRITRLYLYMKCYPLFNALYNKYYTDCESCVEFINDVYLYLMTPNESTGRCYLSTFSFGCSLPCWLKIVVANYCHQLFRRKIDVVSIDDSEQEENGSLADRLPVDSVTMDTDELTKEDAAIVLHLMPNPNYRSLIRYFVVEEKSNEETAALLGITMGNYYNTKRRAIRQCKEVLRKEGLL